MKRIILKTIFMLLFAATISNTTTAQCTNANVNWDNLDYVRTTGSYSPWVTTTMAENQRFAIGVNAVLISTTGLTITGDTTTHTGEGGAFGTGADVQYSGNGTITLTFDSEVTNVQFSLFDVDVSCRTQVLATNSGGSSLSVTLSPATGLWTSSRFTPNPLTSTSTSVGTSPRVDANVTNTNNNSNAAALNVSVAGPVKTITIQISNNSSDPIFWLSDIQACVIGSFPSNYYTISQPFTNQPSWVLAVHDLNTIYMVNPANGRAISIFTDPDPRVREINNVAYDPYKRIIYYSVDGLERCTPAGLPDSIRHIKKYDVNTETISTVVSNVNNSPLSIPTFHSGLESGSAAFYNGSLYTGVEGYFLTGTRNSGRETIIWRIDFASDSITPLRASQVWATRVDNGTNNIHDYADIAIKDGVLYNLNSSTSVGSGRGQYTHVNLQTNINTTQFAPNSSSDRPAQISQSWDGTLYWFGNQIGTYNGTASGTVTNRQTIVNTPRSVTWVGPAGDGGEGFKPKADFGDAPASYDPVALSPAVHERDTALRLGNYMWEWSKNTSSNATGDPDEDAIATLPYLSTSGTGYNVFVNVWNNTGTSARLRGWLDLNNNGLFDAGEASGLATISTSPAIQSTLLTWASTPHSFTSGQTTFLRIRLTSDTNSLNTTSATGYLSDGEVEDYQVTVSNSVLSTNLLYFNAEATNNRKIKLTWKTGTEDKVYGYEIQRSSDGSSNWTTIATVKSKNEHRSVNEYDLLDQQPLTGKSFYRLKVLDQDASFQYSDIVSVQLKELIEEFVLSPNPAKEQASVVLKSSAGTQASVIVTDFMGRILIKKPVNINSGYNTISIPDIARLLNGLYIVQVVTEHGNFSSKLLISK